MGWKTRALVVGLRESVEFHTFRLATRSAVSSRVNWPIWSTMPLIFGLVAAASVDCHLREGFRLRSSDVEDARRRQRVDDGKGDLVLRRQQHAAKCGADKDIIQAVTSVEIRSDNVVSA